MEKKISPFYLLFGDGRLATQFADYFKHTGQPYYQWSRKLELSGERPSLEKLVAKYPTAKCLLALSDSALEEFSKRLKDLGFEKIIHFSGSLLVDGTFAFHPLMTFSYRPWAPHFFERVTFVGTHPEEDFKKFFPFFKNPYALISEEAKSLYHANCVVSGNFANILWKESLKDFEKLGIPKEALKSYLTGVLESFFENPEASLTGPLVRGDLETIEKNLKALQGDFRAKLYLLFLDKFEKEKSAAVEESSHEHS